MVIFFPISPVTGRGGSPASGKGDRDVKSPHTPLERRDEEDRTTPTSSAGGSQSQRPVRPRYDIHKTTQ